MFSIRDITQLVIASLGGVLVVLGLLMAPQPVMTSAWADEYTEDKCQDDDGTCKKVDGQCDKTSKCKGSTKTTCKCNAECNSTNCSCCRKR